MEDCNLINVVKKYHMESTSNNYIVLRVKHQSLCVPYIVRANEVGEVMGAVK